VNGVVAGERPSEVMRRFGLCRTTIYRWLRMARGPGGMGELAARRHPGRAPRLDADRAAEIRRAIVDHTPREQGLDRAFWTRAGVAALVRARFGVSLHPVSAGRLLRRLGLEPELALEYAAPPSVPYLLFASDGRGSFLCRQLMGSESPQVFARAVHALRRQTGTRRAIFGVIRAAPPIPQKRLGARAGVAQTMVPKGSPPPSPLTGPA
jgi:transposase